MARKMLPDAEYLRECFAYDPETGILRWLVRPREHFKTNQAWPRWNTQFSGDICGTMDKRDGRLLAKLNGQSVFVHRVIWKWMTGEDVPEVDHRDRDPSNNRWSNLRDATRQNNTRNKKVHVNNISGLKGVSSKRSGRHLARITVSGETINLGWHSTKELAHEAYCEAARKEFGEFWSDGHRHTPANIK